MANTICAIQSDKLNSLVTAAKVQEVEPIWFTLFAKALEGKDLKDMLVNVGSGGGAAAAPAAGGAAAGGAAAAEEAPKEEEKAAEKEESDDGKGHQTCTDASRKTLTFDRHGFRSFRLSACANLAGAAVHSSSFLVMTKKLFYDWWGASRGGYDDCRADLTGPIMSSTIWLRRTDWGRHSTKNKKSVHRCAFC